jgi:hypothetical protein
MMLLTAAAVLATHDRHDHQLLLLLHAAAGPEQQAGVDAAALATSTQLICQALPAVRLVATCYIELRYR